jgi:hypothetical protein
VVSRPGIGSVGDENREQARRFMVLAFALIS